MRAKTVNFERGLDPKEALDLGNKDLHDFRRAYREGNYKFPLDTIMDLLESGAISNKEADDFITDGIKNHSPKSWQWITWFENTRNIYWSDTNESINITFTLPDFKRIKTWIGKIHFKGVYFFKMRTISTNKNGKGYGISEQNVFDEADYMFNIVFITKQINKVFIETARNID
jgi:hypothetical protein